MYAGSAPDGMAHLGEPAEALGKAPGILGEENWEALGSRRQGMAAVTGMHSPERGVGMAECTGYSLEPEIEVAARRVHS
jgi:hypothetical protein